MVLIMKFLIIVPWFQWANFVTSSDQPPIGKPRTDDSSPDTAGSISKICHLTISIDFSELINTELMSVPFARLITSSIEFAPLNLSQMELCNLLKGLWAALAVRPSDEFKTSINNAVQSC